MFDQRSIKSRWREYIEELYAKTSEPRPPLEGGWSGGLRTKHSCRRSRLENKTITKQQGSRHRHHPSPITKAHTDSSHHSAVRKSGKRGQENGNAQYLFHCRKRETPNSGKMELEETEVGVKIGGRNINNLRYADDTTLLSETEDGLRHLIARIKEMKGTVSPSTSKRSRSWRQLGMGSSR